MRFPGAWRFGAPVVLALLAASPRAEPAVPAGLAPADQAKVRSVVEAYRVAWLANDADAVLRVFAEDSVLMPHHGVEPVVGKPAARAFWFPSGGPSTKVTAFTLTVDQIAGSGDVAYVRGRTQLEWVTGSGADAKRSSNAGTNLAVLRRQHDGSWKIAVLMWDDPLPQAAPARR